jgi:hypothetical protein
MWSNKTKKVFTRKEILPENSLKPTQFKVVSLVEIGEDTAREIGARGLTNLSTFMGKTGQRDDSKETNKLNWFISTLPPTSDVFTQLLQNQHEFNLGFLPPYVVAICLVDFELRYGL